MAKLPSETLETIWTLLRHLSQLVEDATEAEYILFERFGETDATIPNLDDLKNLNQEAASKYIQLSNIRLRIAEAQPIASNDMLRLLDQAIRQNQLRIPAIERSIQEIKMEWNLP
ncbi:hypothetical protein Cri9333_4591 [Crinalium epipsammum PCC 9333]|uniref:Uncharacterized protein n=1 Tax=Crinalium epipsammum PCC 9333 TaxID=1173022 RepID=K9W598_9CYAN|nr:hypothetical protein [Crinalium epipsammum]AFZ15371.1 hypothetical protein Cri9333_4591 [Crinalium epipsammum PCC 9333]